MSCPEKRFSYLDPCHFRLKNGPGTFNCAKDVFLSKVKWHLTRIYPDYIVVFLQTCIDKIELVGQALTLLQDASMKLKLNPFTFLTQGTECFGHVIWTWVLETILKCNINAICNTKSPVYVTELRSFCGYEVFPLLLTSFAQKATALNREFRN